MPLLPCASREKTSRARSSLAKLAAAAAVSTDAGRGDRDRGRPPRLPSRDILRHPGASMSIESAEPATPTVRTQPVAPAPDAIEPDELRVAEMFADLRP